MLIEQIVKLCVLPRREQVAVKCLSKIAVNSVQMTRAMSRVSLSFIFVANYFFILCNAICLCECFIFLVTHLSCKSLLN